MANMIRVKEFELPEREVRQELLAEDRKKPVQYLLQLDVYQHSAPGGDPGLTPDEDGDCLVVSERLALRRFAGVRVHVPVDYDRASAARALRKAARWLEEGAEPDPVENEPPAHEG